MKPVTSAVLTSTDAVAEAIRASNVLRNEIGKWLMDPKRVFTRPSIVSTDAWHVDGTFLLVVEPQKRGCRLLPLGHNAADYLGGVTPIFTGLGDALMPSELEERLDAATTLTHDYLTQKERERRGFGTVEACRELVAQAASGWTHDSIMEVAEQLYANQTCVFHELHEYFVRRGADSQCDCAICTRERRERRSQFAPQG